MKVEKLSKEQWDILSYDAHVAVFKEKRPVQSNRIDYALLCTDDYKKIQGFVTIREIDHESVYWQYGGTLEQFRSTPVTFKGYCLFAERCFEEGASSISTLVENSNTPMLKLALKIGFLVIGTKAHEGKIYLDLNLRREDYAGISRTGKTEKPSADL